MKKLQNGWVKSIALRWALANGIGMSLGFLAFIQTLMFLAFGLTFELHWVSEAVENLEETKAQRLLAIGLIIGLPLAGIIFTTFQALVLYKVLSKIWIWILAGLLGFVPVMFLIWILREIWGDIPGPVEPFTIVGGGLLIIAVLQWLFLRRQGIAATRWLILWIVGLPFGMIVFMGVYTAIAYVIGRDLSWALEVFLIGFCIGGTAAALSRKALFGAIEKATLNRYEENG